MLISQNEIDKLTSDIEYLKQEFKKCDGVIYSSMKNDIDGLKKWIQERVMTSFSG